MATYRTEIHTGGGGWQQDKDLVVHIANRGNVIPTDGRPSTGTMINWASPEGNGNVTFFDDGANFQGTAQFPGEGPVGYRGQFQH